jgi:hypothetical protein
LASAVATACAQGAPFEANGNAFEQTNSGISEQASETAFESSDGSNTTESSTTSSTSQLESSNVDSSSIADTSSDHSASTGDTGETSGDASDSSGTSTSDSTNGDSSTSSDASGETSDDSTTDSGDTLPPSIPVSTGLCPFLDQASVFFAPKGVWEPREARLWFDDSVWLFDGPLVIFWHDSDASPEQAENVLGVEAMAEIKKQGGIVVALKPRENSGTSLWGLVGATNDIDLRIVDEVVGCLHRDLGFDARRIHSVGFGVGGIAAAQMAYRRSSYVASVVSYSGGLLDSKPSLEEPLNTFPALVVAGGTTDVKDFDYDKSSIIFVNHLRNASHYALECDHFKGHNIPSEMRSAALKFLSDHPFRLTPEPYLDAVPSEFPDYCK